MGLTPFPPQQATIARLPLLPTLPSLVLFVYSLLPSTFFLLPTA